MLVRAILELAIANRDVQMQIVAVERRRRSESRLAQLRCRLAYRMRCVVERHGQEHRAPQIDHCEQEQEQQGQRDDERHDAAAPFRASFTPHRT